METKEIILDASVVIKWFTEEVDHEKAKQIRDDFINQKLSIILPDLALYEIANALRYNPKFTKEDVDNAINSILDMDLTITVPTTNVLFRASEIAFKTNSTFYDSFYAALASELNAEFITADKKLHMRIKKSVTAASLLEEY
ncbi:type II toxin-antitoxin system VapC family toxin [Candidatus Pacearchaeota archaeon]|nr:type II toxin-antitoxin system VapC family toxin [Candidatus Pacearchaeota archaeon]